MHLRQRVDLRYTRLSNGLRLVEFAELVADIQDIEPQFKQSIYVVFRGDKFIPRACWVAPEVVRPINHKPTIVKPSSVLHSFCAECKDVFIYPVEANCAEGRVCYSCRSSYGWKYKFI